MLSAILEDFYVAFQGFKNNKGRTILSIIGIMIGISCVITITTLGSSLKGMIKDSLDKFNPCIMLARPLSNFNSINMDDSTISSSNPSFYEKYRKKLMTEVPNIKNVHIVNFTHAHVTYRDMFLDSREVRAVDYGWLEAESLKLDYGEDFEISEYAEGASKVLIGKQIAKWLFPEGNPIGKKILFYFNRPSQNGEGFRMQPKSFEVSGVIADSVDSLVGQPRYYIVIPRKLAIRSGFDGDFSLMDILATKPEYVPEVKKNVIELTNQMTGLDESLEVTTMEEVAKKMLGTLNIVSYVLLAIGALSLLVGGIGIMNIMIVTVTERKQEIGIRKAVGASKKNIVSQFLAESVILTIVGAVLGCILGLGASKVLINIMQNKMEDVTLNLVPDINGMIIAVVVSVFIGIFFGLYPALQAAKLDPVIALEEE